VYVVIREPRPNTPNITTKARQTGLDLMLAGADPHRKYLAGDAFPLIHKLFKRKGTFYLGLYELEDEELEEILIANAAHIHVILANTGLGEDKK
jgi:hypothetical protein